MSDLDRHVAPEQTPPPEQPPLGGFCDDCGHFAGRHGVGGCALARSPGAVSLLGDPLPERCTCPGMLWLGVRWPRPWLPAPAGLVDA